MKNIKFIYFDLGGVIVDHVVGVIKTAELLNLEANQLLAFCQTHANDLDRGTISLSEFEDKCEQEFAIKDTRNRKIGEILVDHFATIQETQQLIYQLAPRYDIGILSNISVGIFNHLKNKKLLPNISYATIIVSANEKHIKPEKEIFDVALAKTGYESTQVLFIDDSPENVTAAQSYGWHSILFNTKKPKESVQSILQFLR